VTLNLGILVSRPRELDELRAAGERLVQDVLVPLSGAKLPDLHP
jgi:hypothetical protein